MEVVLTIPSSYSDIGEQLSNVHAEQKIKHRQALFQILSCLWFLCRQGLALRGDGTECDSNFQQLIRLKARDDTNLADWLKRKEMQCPSLLMMQCPSLLDWPDHLFVACYGPDS